MGIIMIDPFVIQKKCPGLSLVTIFYLKSVLSGISVATPALFWLLFAFYIVLHLDYLCL